MTNLAVLAGLVFGDLNEIVFELGWGLFLDGFESFLGSCEHLHHNAYIITENALGL